MLWWKYLPVYFPTGHHGQLEWVKQYIWQIVNILGEGVQYATFHLHTPVSVIIRFCLQAYVCSQPTYPMLMPQDEHGLCHW